MKRVLCLVLAVVLMAALLAPAATVKAAGFKDVPASLWGSDEINALLDAAGWKWNAAHTERTLPDGSKADLKIPFSAGATFRISRK